MVCARGNLVGGILNILQRVGEGTRNIEECSLYGAEFTHVVRFQLKCHIAIGDLIEHRGDLLNIALIGPQCYANLLEGLH